MTSQRTCGRVRRWAWPWVLVGLLSAAVWAAEAPATTPAAMMTTTTTPAATEHWPNFRGPAFDGSARAVGLPARWEGSRRNTGGDPGRTEGVLWSAKLPGPGSATPAVWGGRVFLTAADAKTGELLAMGLDASDGTVLWTHKHGANRRQGNNDMTAPSPATDGRQVVFLFGTGTLVAYDFAGEELWRRDLVKEFGPLSWNFGYAASPLLYEGRLYVQLMRRPTHRGVPADQPLGSFLLAIDPASGQDLWRQARPSKARDESWESYATPVPHGTGVNGQIVLAGADAVTGHDAATGREVWRREYNDRGARDWRLVPTPVSDGRRLYAPLPRGGSLVALSPGQGTAPLADATAWTLTANVPDVCSPLLYDGRLYVLDGDRRVVTCLDRDTGRPVWRGQLDGPGVIRASPTAADGKVYVIDEGGRVFVLEAGDAFRLLAQIDMGGGPSARSSIVIAAGRLYVRTADALYCIGPAAAADGVRPVAPGRR